MVDFIRSYFNDNIIFLYEKINSKADNATTYIAQYFSEDALDYNVNQIKYLCGMMKQNCIACTMDDETLSIQAIIGKDTIQKQYKPFNKKYFVTIEQADKDRDTCRLMYPYSRKETRI